MFEKFPGEYERSLKLFIPLAIGLALLFIIYLFLDWSKIFPLIPAYMIPPFGKESIIPTGLERGLSPMVIISLVVIIDAITAMFVMWNLDLVKNIPLMGTYIRFFERNSKKILNKRKWLRRFTFLGIMLFVFVPFQGSGAVTASIIGFIIGLKSFRLFTAILIGSIMISVSITYFTNFIFSLIQSPLVRVLIICFLIVLSSLYALIQFKERE